MPETKEMRSQRLTAIEKYERQVGKAFRVWQDKKDELAQARKEYEKRSTALRRMIREKLSAPLFDEEDDPHKPGDADDAGDVKGARHGDRD